MRRPINLGDIVLCRLNGIQLPAIVTKIWSLDCVNLIAFSDLSSWKIANEYVIPKTSVVYRDPRDGVDNCWFFKDDNQEVSTISKLDDYAKTGE